MNVFENVLPQYLHSFWYNLTENYWVEIFSVLHVYLNIEQSVGNAMQQNLLSTLTRHVCKCPLHIIFY